MPQTLSTRKGTWSQVFDSDRISIPLWLQPIVMSISTTFSPSTCSSKNSGSSRIG